MYSTGNTYPEDRWGLGILSWVVDKVGLGNYSLPLFQGMLCIVFLAIISILIVKMLDIKSIVGTVLIPILMTAFPALTITFCYMFTSSYYMLGLLLMTGGVFLAGKYNSIKAYAAALILCTLSLSIYQAYLPFGLSLCLIYLIGCILNHNKNQQLVKKIIAFAAVFASSVVMYFLAAIACRKILNIKNDGYKGIEGNYILSAFRGIFYKIRLAYKAFIIPLSGESIQASDLFPEALRLFLYLTVILFLLALVSCKDEPKKNSEMPTRLKDEVKAEVKKATNQPDTIEEEDSTKQSDGRFIADKAEMNAVNVNVSERGEKSLKPMNKNFIVTDKGVGAVKLGADVYRLPKKEEGLYDLLKIVSNGNDGKVCLVYSKKEQIMEVDFNNSTNRITAIRITSPSIKSEDGINQFMNYNSLLKIDKVKKAVGNRDRDEVYDFKVDGVTYELDENITGVKYVSAIVVK